MGGGMQVTLDGTGSWSELAKQDVSLPADAKELVDARAAGKLGGSGSGGGGMLGFLRGKKGRTGSPKPMERGVLGKEGARVVIS